MVNMAVAFVRNAMRRLKSVAKPQPCFSGHFRADDRVEKILRLEWLAGGEFIAAVGIELEIEKLRRRRQHPVSLVVVSQANRHGQLDPARVWAALRLAILVLARDEFLVVRPR